MSVPPHSWDECGFPPWQQSTQSGRLKDHLQQHLGRQGDRAVEKQGRWHHQNAVAVSRNLRHQQLLDSFPQSQHRVKGGLGEVSPSASSSARVPSYEDVRSYSANVSGDAYRSASDVSFLQDEISSRANDKHNKSPLTTVVVRNIPATYDLEMLLNEFASGSNIDLFYLPFCWAKKTHLSYAFINFVSEAHARQFQTQWQRNRLALQPVSDKALNITFSGIQGRSMCLRKLRARHARSIRCKADRFNPVLFYMGEIVYLLDALEDRGTDDDFCGRSPSLVDASDKSQRSYICTEGYREVIQNDIAALESESTEIRVEIDVNRKRFKEVHKMGQRDNLIYAARLAERAERYDEMAQYMETLAKQSDELSVEERELLSVAYKHAVGSRRAAWRTAKSAEQKEKHIGSMQRAAYAREYCARIETELQRICDTILGLLDNHLISNAPTSESKIFYQKLKADYYKCIAKFSSDWRGAASESARIAYVEAMEKAGKDLAVTHPLRLGLVINYTVFLYEVLHKHDEAINIAFLALEAAVAKLETQITKDCSHEGDHTDCRIILRLLYEIVELWTSTAEDLPVLQ